LSAKFFRVAALGEAVGGRFLSGSKFGDLWSCADLISSGWWRQDDPNVLPLLNNLYSHEWRLFHNFFCPSMKLLSKERIGSKTLKHHDPPKSPYQRIVESPHISLDIKQLLSKQLEKLNPFVLRDAMEKKLKNILNPSPSSSSLQRSLG